MAVPIIASSSTITKLKPIPVLGFLSVSKPFWCEELMAGCANLGLTYPVDIQPLKISLAAKDVDVVEWKGDLLVVGVLEKDLAKDENSKFQNSILKKLDSKLGGVLAEVSAEEDFSGKAGQSTVLRLPGLGTKRVGLIGLGNQTSSVSALRGLGEAVAVAAKTAQASNVAIALASTEGLSSESKLNTLTAVASGMILGIYEDNRFKSESKTPTLKSLDIIGLGTGSELERKLKFVQDVCSGVILGKELVNAPANVLTPGALAAEASKIASTFSDVMTANILTVEECKELKMGSYLGVAEASANPPHFIHLCYKPPSGSVKAKLGIVGKGLTFDSGGYNIKTGPGCSIELMKFDMGGSAAVLGAAKAISQIKPPGVEASCIHCVSLFHSFPAPFLFPLHLAICLGSYLYFVHFVVAACENMISGTGMRPGDVVTASNGKTIEVNNTDAEGRLTLADALVYTCKRGAEKIIDIATLTGACVVALGPSIAGFFTPSDELAQEVLTASEISGEKLWRMPLEESYWEFMKSGVADMLNTGARQGGAITAALFLKQVQWMHIDMAGPVWNDKKRAATGFGVSTLVEWVLKNSS
ncbi:Leucine aminopeptidase 1-like protein [Drosera capensis]